MSLSFAHGAVDVLSTDALNHIYTISGLSFQPLALRFYYIGIQSATDITSSTLHETRGVGFAVSTSSRRCVFSASTNASGNANCGSCAANDCVVGWVDNAGNRNGQLDLNSITSDGFTLIIDALFQRSCTVFWEAWGGSDITVAVVGDIAEPAAIGNQDYTATGFVSGATDQVVMFAGVQSVSALNTGEGQDSGLHVGFATSGNTSNNITVLGNSDDGSATMDTDGYCKTGECLSMIVIGGGNPNARAQLTQFNTDGFRLNWIARALTNRRTIFLAIKGGNWTAGNYTLDGSVLNNTATVSGLSYVPLGMSLIGRRTQESTAGTSGAQDRMGFGTGTSTSSRRSMGILDEDGTASAEIDTTIQYDQVLSIAGPTGNLEAAYDINAMNSNGFQIIVDVNGGVTTEWQGYLTFGSLAAAGAQAPLLPYGQRYMRSLAH